MLGEMFKKCNVEVHFSIIDNDDTIAYYANYFNCIVLSQDKDFWRYKPQNYTIYQYCYISRGYLILSQDK